jgi:hypothetical protein
MSKHAKNGRTGGSFRPLSATGIAVAGAGIMLAAPAAVLLSAGTAAAAPVVSAPSAPGFSSDLLYLLGDNNNPCSGPL